MTLQFHANRLRIRLERSELEQLITGEPFDLRLGPDAALGICRLQACTAAQAAFEVRPGEVQILLPSSELAQLRARLPSKLGLSWSIGTGAPFELLLEVDIRSRPS